MLYESMRLAVDVVLLGGGWRAQVSWRVAPTGRWGKLRQGEVWPSEAVARFEAVRMVCDHAPAPVVLEFLLHGAGYGQKAGLARLMGVSEGVVSDWGSGRRNMGSPTRKLAALLARDRWIRRGILPGSIIGA